MNTNGKTIMVLIAIVLAWFGYGEYQRLTKGLADTQAQVASVAKASKETLESLTAVIEKLSKRFRESEQGSIAIETHEAKNPVVFEPPKQVARIVMHSSENCAPCRAWKATEKAKWELSGWLVEVLDETTTKKPWPWFTVTEKSGVTFEVLGPLTSESFTNAKSQASK